jgi:acyl carrier protein
MSELELPSTFAGIVQSHLPLHEADRPLDEDLDLLAAGLDSLGIVSLVVEVETEYGIKIPDEQLSLDTFRTPATLWSVLSEHGAR